MFQDGQAEAVTPTPAARMYIAHYPTIKFHPHKYTNPLSKTLDILVPFIYFSGEGRGLVGAKWPMEETNQNAPGIIYGRRTVDKMLQTAHPCQFKRRGSPIKWVSAALRPFEKIK